MTDAPHSTDAADGDPPTADEQRLLDALRQALPRDPPPPGLHARAEQLITLLDVDRELAELLAQPAEAVGMRGGGTGTPLTFGTTDGAVAIDLTVDRTSVAGQVLAGVLVSVSLQTRSGVVAVAEPDDLGRFAFLDVPSGPCRLSLHLPSNSATPRVVVTDWFTI